jgi:hypothetical protein
VARQAQIVDILLSSPSDVEEERRFVIDAAREWNSLRSRDAGVFLNILTWEDVVAPGLSDRPQAVINDAVGDEYDWYLGLMWGRFGSPTGAAESGTVEEYERALARYRDGDAIRISMLFKTNDIPLAQLNGAQFDKVREFKKRFAADGGFYGEFDSEDRLRRLLNRIFEDIARSNSGPNGSPPTAPTRSPKPTGTGGDKKSPLPQSDESVGSSEGLAMRVPQDISELGLFEVNDRIQEVAAEQGKFFEDLTAIQQESNREISEATDEMQRLVSFGQAEPNRIKPIVARVTDTLEKSASFLEGRLPSFRDKNDELSALTEHGFDVATDFGTDNANYIEFYDAVDAVAGVLSQNRASIDGMIETTSVLPRMSAQFNRAKKRYLAMNRDLRDEIDRLRDKLTAILQRYDPDRPTAHE